MINRYFIEIEYRGTRFSGFQAQLNAKTIQGDLNKALEIVLKTDIVTTTSSRTDAGVHACQNFLHFDTDIQLPSSTIYNLNAILNEDIVVNKIFKVPLDAHSRFDATSRKYMYKVCQKRNAFDYEYEYFVPYKLNISLMNEAASYLLSVDDFTSFSKKHTDTKTNICKLTTSNWIQTKDSIEYHVESNRFLRGMVRALVGTLLQLGRGKINMTKFKEIVHSHNCNFADFSAPAHGLFLMNVNYPESILNNPILVK